MCGVTDLLMVRFLIMFHRFTSNLEASAVDSKY